jgi:hypothetical protein
LISSAILRDTPRPLSSARADAPTDLDRIIARCLEKEPRARIQTARDVSTNCGARGCQGCRRDDPQGASDAFHTLARP